MELPPLESFSGSWDAYINHVYAVYCEQILHNGLRFRGIPVKPRFTPESKGKIYGFWHVTSEGEIEDDRTPDLRRCERIRWISWAIENVDKYEEITWWDERSKSNDREVVLWVEAEQFVVILAWRSQGYWLLKTAYLASKPHKIKGLRKNRERYWRARKS
ncbi:MAG: oxidoreductase [Desulfurivibrionaceae bacterium]|nr:hypothetical protein [Desulfurivibrionaceae bacterium]